MAQYSYQLSYDFHSGYSDVRGWQYTSIDRISGVSGNVDMSAFDQRIFSDVNWKTPHLQDIAWAKSSKVTDGFPNGTFRGYEHGGEARHGGVPASCGRAA